MLHAQIVIQVTNAKAVKNEVLTWTWDGVGAGGEWVGGWGVGGGGDGGGSIRAVLKESI